jgi:hypothetical protein
MTQDLFAKEKMSFEHICLCILNAMETDDYLKAQIALAGLKGAVHSLLSKNPQGLSNAEIGRTLGIYQGHKGHEGHISRTVLAFLENEGAVKQNEETKVWYLAKKSD